MIQVIGPCPAWTEAAASRSAEGGEHAFVTGWYDAHVYRVGFEGTGGHPKEALAKINRGWIGRSFSPDLETGSRGGGSNFYRRR